MSLVVLLMPAVTGVVVYEGFQSSPFHLVFEEIGQMASSLSYIHTQVNINISDVEHSAKLLSQGIENLMTVVNSLKPIDSYDVVTEPHKRQMLSNLEVHHRDIQTEINRIADLRSLLPVPPASTRIESGSRKTRFVPLLLGVIGTFANIFSRAALHKLEEELSDVRAVQNKLVEIVVSQKAVIEALHKGLQDVKAYIQLQQTLNPANVDAAIKSLIDRVRIEVDRLFRVLQHAQTRRLAVDFLDASEIHQLFPTLREKAAAQQADLLITRPSDLYQIEMSYFFDGHSINLLLHVPIVPKDSLLTLVKLHPFPLPVTEEYSLLPAIEDRLLALSSTAERLSVEIPSTNLLGCHQINRVYLCEKQGVLNIRMNQSCMGSLYIQDYKQAQKLCPMKIIQPTEVIHRLQDSMYLVYSTETQVVTISCPNQGVQNEVITAGVSRFKLEPGCRTKLNDHVVISDYSVATDADIKYVAIPRTPNMNIPEMTNAEVEHGLKRLKEQGSFHPTIQELREIHIEGQDIKRLKVNISDTIQSLHSQLESQVARVKRDLVTIQRELELHVQRNFTDMQQALKDHQELFQEGPFLSEVTLKHDIRNLSSSKTSLVTSIIIWTLFFIICFAMCVFVTILYRKFNYFCDIFSAGFGNIKIANLRPVMVEHFQHMSKLQTSIPKPIEMTEQ